MRTTADSPRTDPTPARSTATPGRVFVCTACGWEYEEEEGLPEAGHPPGTRWEELPDDFTCPECGAGKDWFVEA